MMVKVQKIEIDFGVGGWAWHALARNGKKLGWAGERNVKFEHLVDACTAVTDCFSRGIPVYVTDANGVRKGFNIEIASGNGKIEMKNDCWITRRETRQGKVKGGKVTAKKAGRPWRTPR